MQFAKRLGWILAGVVIGVAGVVGIDGQVPTVPARITVVPLNIEAGQSFSFVRDSKSGVCWLMATPAPNAGANTPVSLASAPKEACALK